MESILKHGNEYLKKNPQTYLKVNSILTKLGFKEVNICSELRNDTYCNELTLLPDHIKFNNKGCVYLHDNRLTTLPSGIEFNNGDDVSLFNNLLTSLPEDIKFNNSNTIYLYNNPLESLQDNIDEYYSKLDKFTKRYIQEKFPDHWVHDKIRFNL